MEFEQLHCATYIVLTFYLWKEQTLIVVQRFRSKKLLLSASACRSEAFRGYAIWVRIELGSD